MPFTKPVDSDLICALVLQLSLSQHDTRAPAVPLIHFYPEDKPLYLCVGLNSECVAGACVDLCAHGLP